MSAAGPGGGGKVVRQPWRTVADVNLTSWQLYMETTAVDLLLTGSRAVLSCPE